jgi:hypothetical protein
MRPSLFFSFSIALLLVPSVAAATSPVVITEISPVGSAVHEWIEIQNISAADVDLTAWKFWEENTNHGLKLFQGTNLLTPSSTAIIAEDATTFLLDHPTSTLTVFDSSWSSLASTGERIGLRDAAGILVEDITYPDTHGAAIERIDIFSDPTAATWCEETIATPGSANSCPLVLPLTVAPTTPTTPLGIVGTPQLVLSEIFPAPASGGKEWVEVWNAGDGTALAHDCTLSDTKSTITTFTEDIPPQTYAVATLTSAKLNNDGDTVSLICAGVTVDSVIYGTSALPAPETDESIARTSLPSGAWAITTTPTTNADNTITAPPTTPLATKNNQQTSSRSYAVGRVLINEIFPGNAQTAWIEIANPENHTLSLDGWKLLINTDAPIALAGTLSGNGHVVIDQIASGLEGTRGIALLVDPEGYTSEEVLWGSADATEENNAPATTAQGTSIARLFDAFSSGKLSADFVETTTPTPKAANTITATRNEDSPLVFSEILPDPSGPDGATEFIEIKNRSSSTVSTVGWHVTIGNRRPRSLPATEIAPHAARAFFRFETHLALPNAGANLTVFEPNGRVADSLNYTAADSGVAFAEQGGVWAWTTTPTPNLPNTIVKPNHPPHPVIQVTDPETPGEPFIFDASDAWDEDGSLASVLWDMGDGTKNSATTTAHSFATAGRHRIKLTVFDEAGISATGERSVTVAKNDLDITLADTDAIGGTTNAKPRVLGAKTTKKVTKKTTAKKAARRVEQRQGTILVEPGILGVRMVAVNTLHGNQLLEVPKQHEPLRRGDLLSATGTERERSGKTFFSATAIHVRHGPPPEAAPLTTLEETEAFAPYSLVRIQGIVIEHKTSRLTIANQGEISVVLPKGFSSRAGTLTEAEVNITGIVRPVLSGGVEIVARDEKDVVILSAPPPAEKKKEEAPLSPASAGVTGAAGGILISSGWGATGALRRRLLALFTHIQKPLVG